LTKATGHLPAKDPFAFGEGQNYGGIQ
jgi:hypothetical protein